MKKVFCMILLVCFVQTASYSQEADAFERSVLMVNIFSQAPNIDGKLDDICWKKASGKSRLFLTAKEGKVTGSILEGKGETSAQTVFYVGYDRNKFYFAARCEEPQMEKIRTSVKERDQQVWNDDSIDIYLDTNDDCNTLKHIIVNPLGVIYDADCVSSAGKEDKKWNSDINVATFKGEDYWTIEFSISFKGLGCESPQNGEVWAINVARAQKPARELSSWADVGQNFGQPSLFGNAVFGNAADGINRSFISKRAKMFSAIKIANIQVAKSEKPSKHAMEKISEAKEILQELSIIAEKKQLSPAEWVSSRKALAKLDKISTILPKLATGYQIWQKSIWGPLGYDELPPAKATEDLKTIEIYASQNAYRAAGFAITNFQDETLETRILLPDFKGSNSKIPSKAVTLRVAQFVELRGGVVIPDALPKISESRIITVPSGETRLVWLDLATHGILPGYYKAKLTIQPLRRKMPKKHLEVKITVLPIELDRSSSPVSPWVSMRWPWGNGAMNRQVMHDLMAHGMNVVYVWLQANNLYPVCDKDGNVIKFNVEAWDKLIKNAKSSPDCPSRIRLRLAMGLRGKNCKKLITSDPDDVPLDFLSPEWKKALGSYLVMLRDHLATHGIRPEDMTFYTMDEPTSNLMDQLAEIADFIHSVDSRFKVYVNPPGYKYLATEALRKLDGHVDIYSPYINRWGVPAEKKFYDAQIEKGNEVWGYTIHTKASKPLARSLRTGHWLIFKKGWTGLSGFWCYDAFWNDCWDDFDTHRGRSPDWTMIYTNRDEGNLVIIPSRRWEAWREGVEDFRTLRLLSELCKQAKNKGIDVRKIEQLLKDRVDDVLDMQDPEEIEIIRVEIMKTVAHLKSQIEAK